MLNLPSTKIAGVLLLASVLLFIFCFIVSGGSLNANASGGVWWYFLFFGVPSALYGLLILFFGFFGEATKSKTVTVGRKQYGLGSVLILVSLIAFLVYILLM